jgi:phospholipid/cholesterol/gamma-HCH transport system substrate-binding protein
MKRRDEVLVGIFTTVAVLVAAVGTLWLVRGGLSPGYPLYSRFSWGAGVKEGQPVWLNGVTVGFVDKVELDPTGTVVVAMRIAKKYKVPQGTTAALVANGFFGDQAVGLQVSVPNPKAFQPRDTVPVRAAGVGIQALTQRADTISAGITSILVAARSQLVDSGGIANLRRTVASLNSLTNQLASIANVQSRELQSTLATTRNRIAAIDSLQVDSTVRSMRQAAGNLSTFTGQLQKSTDRMNALLALADSGNGSLAKLLRDPAAHDSVLAILGSMHSLIEDLKKNPRKYINLRIF